MSPPAAPILMLAPQPFFRLRGMCLAQQSCLRSLSAAGCAVDLLTFPFGEDVAIAGVRILRVKPAWGIRDIPIGPSLAKIVMDGKLLLATAALLRRRRYRVVHACEESAFLAALLKPFFRFKLVYDMDDVLSRRLLASGFLRWEGGLALVRALERWTIRSADVVLTNSAETSDFARSIAGPDRVLFYHHAPPLPEAPPRLSREQIVSLRRGCGLDGQHVVLYAGNLEPYQGVELLLESLAPVLARRPRTCCVIIGGEARQVGRLRRRADELGIGHAVRWLGKRPLAETFRFMQLADVLVSPMNQRKAVPMKLYAYVRAGSPIVATRLSNETRLLDEDDSILVEPEPASLAEGILRALQDPPPRSRADRAGRPASEPWREAGVLRAAYSALGLCDAPAPR